MSGAGRKLTIRMPDNPRLRGASVGRLHVDPGMRVAEGSPVLTLIVRGREHKVRAPKPGRVVPLVAPGDPAISGDPLYILNIDEDALHQANRESRALVPADKAKWSEGVKPELIEPMVRSRTVGRANRSYLGRFAAAWGKPILAIALYVLACFALLPIMRVFGQGAAWPTLVGLSIFALLFAGLINNLYSSVSGWFARSTVHLVAISWVGLSALAIFGPPEAGEDWTLNDAGSQIASLFTSTGGETDDALVSDPEQTAIVAAKPADPPSVAEAEANTNTQPAVVEQPVITLAVLSPPTTAGVGTGRPLAPAAPVQEPPKSVLPSDVATSLVAHGIQVRETSRTPPSHKPGDALAEVLAGEVPPVQTSVLSATSAAAPSDINAPESAAFPETVIALAATETGAPRTGRTDTEQPFLPVWDDGPLTNSTSERPEVGGAGADLAVSFASAEWQGSDAPEVLLESLAAVAEVVVIKGDQRLTTAPQEVKLALQRDFRSPPSSEPLSSISTSSVEVSALDTVVALDLWLMKNGLPVPQVPLASESLTRDKALLTSDPVALAPVDVGVPMLLASVVDADPFAYRTLRSGEGDWMLALSESAIDAENSPDLPAATLPVQVDRAERGARPQTTVLEAGSLADAAGAHSTVSGWLENNGLPVPEAPDAAVEPKSDAPSLETDIAAAPDLADAPLLLSEATASDPVASENTQFGRGNQVLAQVDALASVQANPHSSIWSSGDAPTQPEVMSDIGPIGLDAKELPFTAPEPGTLIAAVSSGLAPRIPAPEPAFEERLLLFIYFDDPRAENHPGVGDKWVPQLSAEVAPAIRAARVEAVREVVQVSAWCEAADDSSASDRTAWLSDRIRLLQVRIAVEPKKLVALETELPVFGGTSPGFFHNFRPLLGGRIDAPVMERGWDYLQAAGGERAVYFDEADGLADALHEAGCTDAAWDGSGPVNDIGRKLDSLLKS